MVVGTAAEDRSIYNNAQAHFNGASYYITAAWDEEGVAAGRVPVMIVVGDGTVYTVDVNGGITYTNVELSVNTQYTIFTRYDLRDLSGDGAGVR